MGRSITTLVLCVLTIFTLTGCYTQSRVNFGNNSGSAVRVQSSQTGQEINVPAGKFRRFPHGYGDLIISTQANERFKFSGIVPFVLDDYVEKKESFFGPGYVTLNMMIESNMDLYVLRAGKRAIDKSVPQPAGYPKPGIKMPN
jgi:hypothetical protein